MKLKKALNTGKQVIPAGEELHFSPEGKGFFNGEVIDIYKIPTHAIEMDESMMNNQIDPDNKWKDFDKIEPGDKGTDQNGEAITFFGKAVGPAGYDALVTQFGNTSPLSIEDMTVDCTEDEINEMQFVAYANTDGSVFVTRYGNDFAAAIESDGDMVPFDEVEPAMTGITSDGDDVTILGTGVGKVWFAKTCEEHELECVFAPFEEMLEEGVSSDTLEFALCNDEDNNKSIMLYGKSGVYVPKTATATESRRTVRRNGMITGKRTLNKR